MKNKKPQLKPPTKPHLQTIQIITSKDMSLAVNNEGKNVV